jgi:Ca2+-binding EF-hand superfamily protein
MHSYQQTFNNGSQQISGLTVNEQAQISNFFLQVSGTDRGIDRSEFMRIVLLINPNLRNNPQFSSLSDSLFNEIDSDRSGIINQNEFIMGYGRLRHRLDSSNMHFTQPQQSIYAHQHSSQPKYNQHEVQSFFQQIAGYDRGINRQEFTSVLLLINPNLRNNQQLALLSENLFRQIDQNGSGNINEIEFLSAYPSLRHQLV